MFTMQMAGKIVSMSEARSGDAISLIIQPMESLMALPRADEEVGPIRARVHPSKLPTGVGFGSVVQVEGFGVIGRRKHTKREFGKEKSMEIENVHFEIHTIKTAKAAKVEAA